MNNRYWRFWPDEDAKHAGEAFSEWNWPCIQTRDGMEAETVVLRQCHYRNVSWAEGYKQRAWGRSGREGERRKGANICWCAFSTQLPFNAMWVLPLQVFFINGNIILLRENSYFKTALLKIWQKWTILHCKVAQKQGKANDSPLHPRLSSVSLALTTTPLNNQLIKC